MYPCFDIRAWVHVPMPVFQYLSVGECTYVSISKRGHTHLCFDIRAWVHVPVFRYSSANAPALPWYESPTIDRAKWYISRPKMHFVPSPRRRCCPRPNMLLSFQLLVQNNAQPLNHYPCVC